MLHFEDQSGRKYSATYLPEVPPDAGFTIVSSIKELIRKSGFTGKLHEPHVTCSSKNGNGDICNAKLTIYQSTRVKMSSTEYRRRVGWW